MSIASGLVKAAAVSVAQCMSNPKTFCKYVQNARSYARGFDFGRRWSGGNPARAEIPKGKLIEYFRNNSTGPGIWKWEHYFEVYERHLGRFSGRSMSILEIGIYSGGSLGMWRHYFGESCRIYGVDIEPACKVYENDFTKVFVGDQEDRSFWAKFRSLTRDGLDVVIDDGGHQPEQQMVTLEEMLPHLKPGGVYICEDVDQIHHEFCAFASGLIGELNRPPHGGPTTSLQKCIHSIHIYPYMIVIEKHSSAPQRFHAPKFGTEWQPFSPKAHRTAQAR